MKLIKIDWIERDVDFVIQLDDISLEDIKTKEFKTFVKDILIKQMYYRDKDIDITGLCLSEVDKNNVREDDIWIGVWKKEDGEFSTCVVLDYPNTQSSLYMDKALFGETWGFTQVYLSCPVEITKELYRKGDTIMYLGKKQLFSADRTKSRQIRLVYIDGATGYVEGFDFRHLEEQKTLVKNETREKR